MSDVVVQNVNVISSPACEVVCLKKHHFRCFTNQVFYVRNIPIRSYTINRVTIIITTITIIIIIITIIIITSPPSSSLSSSLSLSLNPPPSSSSPSVTFYISLTSEVHVLPSHLNSSVFCLPTCFLLFIGFRCDISLTEFLLTFAISINFLERF